MKHLLQICGAFLGGNLLLFTPLAWAQIERLPSPILDSPSVLSNGSVGHDYYPGAIIQRLAGTPQQIIQPPYIESPVIEGPVIVTPSIDAPVIGEGEAISTESIDLPIEPVWNNPFTWLGPHWNGSVSLGINGSEGNAESFNIRSGFELSRETERTNWDTDLTYNKASAAAGLTTAHNALLQSTWDYKLSNPRLTWFNKFGLEYDEFKNFDLRLFLNTGAGYTFIDNERTQLRGRFGSGVSREYGGIDEDVKPEAVFGVDYSRQLTERQRFVATIDYYPSWEDFSDYRLVTDLGWEIALDAPSNLSVKVGVIDRYDSTPNGAEPNDLDYSFLLIWTL